MSWGEAFRRSLGHALALLIWLVASWVLIGAGAALIAYGYEEDSGGAYFVEAC